MIRRRLEQTDMILGCSEHITRTIVDKFPEYKSRCVTVPNGTSLAPDAPKRLGEEKTVLFVGRLSPEKGLHDLIRAFHEVLRRCPDARLRLVGPPGSAPLNFLVGLSTEPHVVSLRRFYPESGNGAHSGGKDPYLKALENEAGPELGKRIFFEGPKGHHEISEYYQRAALLVNPSLIESFGISLIEAMTWRTPVVVTRIGGMNYTVDETRSLPAAWERRVEKRLVKTFRGR
jgi:glycosyltransferase involved in cell wall biosynthesis